MSTHADMLNAFLMEAQRKSSAAIESALEAALQTGVGGVRVHQFLRKDDDGWTWVTEAEPTAEVPYGVIEYI